MHSPPLSQICIFVCSFSHGIAEFQSRLASTSGVSYSGQSIIE